MTLDRRSLLAFLAASAAPLAHAVQRKSLADPLRLGAENALVDSGLASQLQKTFGRDTGVAVQLVPGHSAALLEALERGELDAAMTNAPEQEAQLEKQGLAHDRRLIAQGDFVLVGPFEGTGKKAKDPVGVAGETDIAVALAKIAQAQARFIGPVAGSGAYIGTLALWRAAKISPAAPWYVESKAQALDQAQAEGAYTLVERGLWLARSRKPLALMVEGDPRMATEVHVMRSFRVNHPAAKLFGQWVSGPQGRRVAGSVRGWRPGPA
ncbi:MAG TPA: substrate-binding domain-containing protein [Rhizobacter sp.]|nr:substrate-binding domain-containing protein [Rhizobacter sp.]